jgi:hypothetical protein
MRSAGRGRQAFTFGCGNRGRDQDRQRPPLNAVTTCHDCDNDAVVDRILERCQYEQR